MLYALRGVAAIEMDGLNNIIRAGEGLHAVTEAAHQVENESTNDVEFRAISQSITSGDHENL